ncbi:MAG TPA: APC family permease [Gemmatimonadales bacterium]
MTPDSGSLVTPDETSATGGTPLIRGVGVVSATALNMTDMIGVGPFITIPLIITAMGGPQAMLGWIFGALFAICDGLVWAELGAAIPGSGGSYGFLKEIYGPNRLGRLVSFLFIWQLSFSGPLSIASGGIGLARYAGYFWPQLDRPIAERSMHLSVPLLGALDARVVFSLGTLVAIGALVLAVVLLYRRITAIGWLSRLLWLGVMATVGWVIFAGVTHFDPHRAFSFPAGAFRLTPGFFTGLGAAMLVATYDYWGYYNVCFLGDEVKDPGRTIPRALLISIVLVAIIYIVMNISILGVLPWQELDQAARDNTRFYVVSIFMQRIYGNWAASLVTVLIMWTAFASVFALLLGYSRVPYAAAVDGNYFPVFGRVHSRHRFPYVSLLVLGAAAMAACFLQLADIIAALVVIRIMVQFLFQTVGIIVLRIRRPDLPRPFRMWLYPLPALLATFGFLFVLIERKNFLKEVRYAVVIVVAGIAIYLVRSWRRREWPFGAPQAQAGSPEPANAGRSRR